MKRLAASVFLALAVTASGWTQSLEKIGFRVELASPKASVAETQKQGIGGNVMAILSLGPRAVQLATMLDFVTFPGDYKWIQGEKIEYDSRYVVTVAVGPRVGNERGAYIIPALSVSFGSLYDRPDFKEEGLPIGVDFSVGTLVPVAGRGMLDVGVRLAMTNFLTESIPEGTWGEGVDLEMLSNIMCLYVGLSF